MCQHEWTSWLHLPHYFGHRLIRACRLCEDSQVAELPMLGVQF